MSVTLYSEGAAGEVTGSRHFLEADGERLLIDCGAFQGHRREADEKNRRGVSDPQAVTSVILTHAHFDHSGMLPLLVKQGYEGNVFSTPATRDLATLIMEDSARIQERDADYLARKARKEGREFEWSPLYATDDVERTAGQFVTVSYGRGFSACSRIRARFHDAGHILGSAMVHATVANGSGAPTRVLYSGDLGRGDTAIIRDPEEPPASEYVVLESTYGDRLHDSTSGAMSRLAEVVNRTVERGGKVIIPAFAIERTQEIVYYLHLLTIEKRIPEVPIWVDSPMAISATGIFQAHPDCYDRETYERFISQDRDPFGFDTLHFSRSVDDSKRLNGLREPAIIISASGMCEAGRIQHHLIHNVGNPRNTILVVGFMAKHTLGRRIVERQERIRIQDRMYDLRAEVAIINAFSAHADYREMGEWLSRMDRSVLKGIFLVHGEDQAQGAFADYLTGLGFPTPVIVEYGERYVL